MLLKARDKEDAGCSSALQNPRLSGEYQPAGNVLWYHETIATMNERGNRGDRVQQIRCEEHEKAITRFINQKLGTLGM